MVSSLYVNPQPASNYLGPTTGEDTPLLNSNPFDERNQASIYRAKLNCRTLYRIIAYCFGSTLSYTLENNPTDLTTQIRDQYSGACGPRTSLFRSQRC